MPGEGRGEQQSGIKERVPDAKVNFAFKPWRRKTGRDHESSPSAGTSLSHFLQAQALWWLVQLLSEQESSCCRLESCVDTPCPK